MATEILLERLTQLEPGNGKPAAAGVGGDEHRVRAARKLDCFWPPKKQAAKPRWRVAGLTRGDWVELGSADEQKPAKDGTVEAWGRSADNPIGGWYGLKQGLRGRFGMYVPPLMEHLGRAEVEHNARGNRMRAV